MKHELDVIAKKLSSSVEIGYNLALNSFKKESKKKGLGEYYYLILNIPVIPPTHLLKLRIKIETRVKTLRKLVRDLGTKINLNKLETLSFSIGSRQLIFVRHDLLFCMNDPFL